MIVILLTLVEFEAEQAKWMIRPSYTKDSVEHSTGKWKCLNMNVPILQKRCISVAEFIAIANPNTSLFKVKSLKRSFKMVMSSILFCSNPPEVWTQVPSTIPLPLPNQVCVTCKFSPSIPCCFHQKNGRKKNIFRFQPFKTEDDLLNKSPHSNR